MGPEQRWRRNPLSTAVGGSSKHSPVRHVSSSALRTDQQKDDEQATIRLFQYVASWFTRGYRRIDGHDDVYYGRMMSVTLIVPAMKLIETGRITAEVSPICWHAPGVRPETNEMQAQIATPNDPNRKLAMSVNTKQRRTDDRDQRSRRPVSIVAVK